MTDPFDLATAETPPAHPTRNATDTEPPYLATLNDAQRQAVEAMDGPVLVLAGAGTGKTRVLTARLAHILWTSRAWPSQVLAVTFTNKAAREMQERLEAMLGGTAEGLWMGTFHAIGVRILRRHAELAGLKPNFTILDSDDQQRLLKQILTAANIDEKRWPARGLAAVIERWKNAGLTPDKVSGQGDGFADGRAQALYKTYQERLAALNAADFGDLLLHCLTIFTRHRDVLEQYQRRFRYILVDEYQDTNVAQYLWLRLLAQGQRNICCVGDDDQSIYGWRGAEVGNILRFEKDFPGARVIRLERNYRSTPHILGAASEIIAHNEGRLGKTLWTDADGGEKVTVIGVWDGDSEARMVGDEVEALQVRGEALNEIAILVRAGFQTRAFEERFINLGVPYRVIGGPRFYERREIRDAIAYLRVIVSPENDLSFERIFNLPKRGLGDAALRAVHGVARTQGLPLTAAARLLVETEDLRPQARNSLRRLIELFDRWRALSTSMRHPELVETVLDESGYTDMWLRDKSADAPGRLDNLKELVRALADFESLGGFLDHVSLVMENAERSEGDMVSLMTLHGAKGLEFDTVFLPGWEEDLFPHQRALDEGGQAALEEERRLAYVGLTRARKRVFISFAANRRVYDRWISSLPSRFVEELPEEHVEHRQEAGLPGATGAEDRESQWQAPSWLKPAKAGNRGGSPIHGLTPDWPTGDRASPSFKVGQRIFHQKFGYGRITETDGNKLLIAFEKTGSKKVLESFVQPA